MHILKWANLLFKYSTAIMKRFITNKLNFNFVKGGTPFLLSLVLILGMSFKANAVSYTWTGATSTAWATTTNWIPNGNPGSAVGDDVTIGVVAFTSGNQPALSVAPANALTYITIGTATASTLSISVNYLVGNLTIGVGSTVIESGSITVSFTAGINNSGTYTASIGVHSFLTNNQALSGTLSMPSVTVTGISLVNIGTVTIGTALTGVGGIFTNASTGTLSVGGTLSIATFQNGGTTTFTGSNITTLLANFINNGILNLQGSGAITGITNSNGGTVNLVSSSTITSFINGNSCTLNISTTPNVPTITTMTATAAGNVVIYSGAGSQTVKSQAYLNLTLSGSGLKTLPTGTSVGNKLSISPTGTAKASLASTVSLAIRALFLGGTNRAANTYGSSVSAATTKNDSFFNPAATFTGILTVAVISPFESAAGGGDWATAATWVQNAVPSASDDVVIGSVVTVPVLALTQTGSVTINSGGALTWSSGNVSYVFGDFTINGAGSASFPRPITFNGNLIVSGTIAFSSSTATARAMVFNGNVQLETNAVWTEPAAGVNGDVNTYDFAGNFTNNASTFTGIGTAAHTFSGLGKLISGGVITDFPRVTISGTYQNSGIIKVGTALAGTGTLINSGTLNIGAASSITRLINGGNISITGSGLQTTALANYINTGTINLGGSGAITGITNNYGGIVNLSSSGTIAAFTNAAASTLKITTTPTVPTITTLTVTATGNTVNYTGAGAQTVKTGTFYHLGLSGSGVKTMTGVTSIGGDFNMSGAATATPVITTIAGNTRITGTAAMTTGANLAITGSLTIGDSAAFTAGAFTLGVGTTTSVGAGTSGSLTISGAGLKTFTGSVTIATGGIWTNSGNSTTSFGAGITNNSVNTFSNGTGAAAFSATQSLAGSGAITFGGGVTPSVGSTLTNSNSGTVSINNIVLTGNFTQGLNTPTLTLANTTPFTGVGTFDAITNVNTVNYTGASQAIKVVNYSNLTINGSGIATIGGAINVNGTMTVTSATTNNSTLTVATALSGADTLTQGASSTLNVAGTTAITGLKASNNANSVNYTGAMQTVKAAAYSALSLSGSGVKTMTGVTTIGGDFIMSGSVTATSLITTIGGNISITGTAAMITGANNAVTGGLTVGTGATLSLGGFSLSIGGSSSITGAVNTVSAATGTKTFTGAVTINSGGSWDFSGQNPATSFGAGITNNSVNTFSNGTGAAVFSATQYLAGSGAMTFGGSVTPAASTTLTNSNSGTVYIDNILLTGNFTQGLNAPTLSLANATPFSGVGTFDASTNANTVDYTGTSQTVKPVAYGTLNLSGTGSLVMTGVTTVNYDLHIGADVITTTEITNIGHDLSIEGSMTTGSNLIITGNVTIIGSNSVIIAGAFTLTVGGTTTIGDGTTHSMVSISGIGLKTFTGQVMLAKYSNWYNNGSAATSFGGGITNNGTTFSNGTGAATFSATQSFAGSGPMTFGGSVTPVASTTLTNSNSGTVLINNIVLTGNFTQGLNTPTLTLKNAAPFSGSGTFDASTNSNTVNYTGASQAIKAANYRTLNINGTGTATIGGVTTVSGTMTVTSATTNNSTLTATTALSGAGTLTQGAGSTLNIGDSSTITGLDASTNANTVNYTGASQTVRPIVYSTLGLSGSGAIAMTGITTLGGSFNISGTVTATPVISTIGGNVSITGAAIMTTGANNVVTGSLTVGTGATLSLGGFSLIVGGTSSITGNVNTLTAATGTKIFTGAVTINVGGTWDLSGQDPATSFGGGIIINGNTFDNGTGAAAFSATQSLAGSGAMNFGGSITPANSTTLTNSNSGTVSINNIVLAGNFTQGLNTPTLTLVNAAPFSGSGTFDASTNANTVSYTGASQAIKSANYSSLSINGTGIAIIGGAVTVSGTMTVTSATTNNSTLTVTTALSGAGTLTQGAGSVLNIGGTSGILGLEAVTNTNEVNYTGAAQTLMPTAYSTLGLSGSGAKTMTGVTTLGGSFNMSGSVTATPVITAIGGEVSIIGTASITTGANLSITGALSIGNGAAFTVGAFTLDIGAATTVGGGTSGTFTISGASGLTFTGAVTVAAGGTWTNSGNATTIFGADVTNNSVNNFANGTGAASFLASSSLLGSGPITFGGSVTPANSTTITNNNSGTVSINDIVLTGNFTQGANSKLRLNATSPISGAGSFIASAVSNSVSYTGASAAVFATTYNKLTITGATSTIGGTTIVNDTMFVNNTTTNNSTLTITTALSGTSTLTQGATGILNIGGASGITTLVASAVGNTVNYTGTTQTVKDINYNILGISGNGVKTWTEATIAKTVAGNLIVNNSATLNIAGAFAWTVTGTTTIGDGINGTLATLGITNATGVKTFTGNVSINNDGYLNESAAAAVGLAGSLSNNGTYTASTGTHTFSGASNTIGGTTTNTIPSVTFTAAYTNNGTLTVATLLTITGVTLTNTGTINSATSITGSGILSNTSGTVNITGGGCSIATNTNAGTFAFSNAATSATVLLNFTNTGTINISGSGTILAITNNAGGIVNHSGSSIITSFNNATSTSTLNINTTPTVPTISTLTMTAAGNTVNYTGLGAQTVKAGTYSNLGLSGSGAKTTTSVIVNNLLTMAGSATVSVVPTYTASTTLKYDQSATAGLEWPATFGGEGIIINSGTMVINNAQKIISGYLSIMTGAVLDLGTNTSSTVHSLIFGSTGQSATGSWGYTGATNNNTVFFANNSGLITTAATTSIVSAATGNWSAIATWTGGVVPGAQDSVTILIGTTVTVDGDFSCKSLQLANTAGTANLAFTTGVSPILRVAGAVRVGNSVATQIGTITFSSGSTLIAGSLALGPIAAQASSIIMTAGGLLKVNGAITNTSSTAVWTPGTGTVELAATITLPTTKFITFYNLTVSGGTTTLGVATAVTGTLTYGVGATLALSTFALSLSGNFVNTSANAITGSGAFTITGTATQSIAGFATSGPVSFTKTLGTAIISDAVSATNLSATGAGKLILQGSNTFSGTLTLSAGTLQLSHIAALGTAATNLALNGGALLLMTATSVNAYNITVGGAATISTDVATIGSGVTHSLGTLTIGAFTLTINGGSVLAGIAGLSFTSVTHTAAPIYTVTNPVGGGITKLSLGAVANSTFLTTFNGNGNVVQSDVFGNGSGGITYSGTGELTLFGANTYSGITTISSGTLKLGASSSVLGTVAGITTIASGAVLDLNGYVLSTAEPLTLNGAGLTALPAGVLTNNGGDASFSGPITLAGASTISATSSGTLTCSGAVAGAFALILNGPASSSGTMSGIISTPTSVAKNGVGAWTLSGVNTYTGTTDINIGTLKLGASTSVLGTVAGRTTVASGAVLDLNGFVHSTAEPLTINGTGLTASPAGALTNTGGNASFKGPITLGLTSTITATTSGTLTCSGALALGAFGLNMDGTAGSNGTLSGIISTITYAGIDIYKEGAGTWTLSGVNTYENLTVINNGTLKLGVSSSTAANSGPLGAVSSGFQIEAGTIVASGASLDLNGFSLLGNSISILRTEQLTINGSGFAGLGAVTNSASGTSTFTCRNTLATAASINGEGGLIIVKGPYAIISGTTAITLGGAVGGNIDSAFAGDRKIIKEGVGTWTLSGANTYTGITMISAGTLKLGASSTLATEGPLGTSGATSATGTNIANGASLDMNGFSLTSAATEYITLNGLGVSSLGALTNSAPTASTQIGVLYLATDASVSGEGGLLNITGTSVSGATSFTFGGAAGGSISSLISGPMAVVKNGIGTWTISKRNTFRGGATLNAGTLKLNNTRALGDSTSTFTINGGAIDNGSNADSTLVSYPIIVNGDFGYLGASASLNLAANDITLNVSPTITVNADTLTLGAVINAQTVNLTKAGAGTLLLGSTTKAFNSLTVSAGTLFATSDTLYLAGNFTNNGTFTHNGGKVKFNGTSANDSILGSASTSAFNELTVANSGAVVAIQNIIVGGNLTVNSLATLEPGAAYTVGGAGTLTGSGTVKVTRTTGTADFLTQYPITTKTISNLCVNYSGASSQSVNALGYYNLTISGAGTKTYAPADLAVSNALQIDGGATFDMTTNKILGFSSNSGSGTLKTQNTSSSPIPASKTWTSVVNYGAAGAQTIVVGNYNGLIISGGAVYQKTLAGALSVSGVLNLTSGKLISTASNLLSLTSTSSVGNVSDSSFVDGPMKKTGNTAFVFPAGKTGVGYQAIAISAPTNVTDAFTAEYIRASPHNVFGTAHTAPLLNLDSCEYWQLDRTIGTSAVDVTIYGNANSGCGGSTGSNFFTGNGTILSNLIVAHWNSTLQSWENATAGATTVTGTTSALTVKAPSVNSFSPFIFGAVGNNPLPVKLISFKAKAIGRVINLTWVTASEINNDYFDIERSNDGLHFIKIGQIKGNGTTSNTSSYGYNDVLELEENTMIYYYRLKQVDYSGDYEYSMIRWVNIGLAFQPIIETVKPNPFNDILTVTYAYSEKGKATLEVVNLEGLLVFRKEASSVKGYNQFQVNTESLSKGVYYIRINVNGVDSKYGKVVKL